MNLMEAVKKNRRNFLFYAERFLKIKDMNNRIVPLKLNYVQRRILWPILYHCLKNNLPIRLIHAKARRMGASTLYESFIFWRTVHYPMTESIVISHDLESGKYLFSMCDLFYKYIPEILRPRIRRGNVRELAFDSPIEDSTGLRSRIYVETCKNANLGRSKQVSLFHGSEVAFWSPEKAHDLTAAVEQAVPEKPGTMIIYESTGYGASGEFYDRFMSAREKGENSIWKAIFVPWFLLEEYRLELEKGEKIVPRDDEEDFLMNKLGVSPQQIKWRRYTFVNKCDSDPDTLHREYPSTAEEAFLFSATNIFPISLMKKYMDYAQSKRPAFIGEITSKGLSQKTNGRFRIYKFPQPYRDYCLGVDVSEGIDEDNSSIQVVDLLTLEQVATWVGSIDPSLLADVAYLIGYYYNYGKIAIEANNHGLTTITGIRDLGYKHLYKAHMASGDMKYGWHTTKRTKPLMEDKFKDLLREGDVIINDPELINEMNTYIQHPNGTTGHSSGAHDDRVLSLMIALICALESSHLIDRKKDTLVSSRKGLTIQDIVELDKIQRRMGEINRKNRDQRKRIFPLSIS